MKKRLFAILLTLCMVCGMIPAASAAAGALSKSNLRQVDGTASNNIYANNYINAERWASTVKSYLYTEANGTLVRVELTSDQTILVESYDPATLARKSYKTISGELSKFGGFFAGEKYNYLVFAQDNLNDDDSVEVLRVVKYSKDWTRLSACSIKGANTYRPLMAGSLRMIENAGKLYIYTCHEMYLSGDGNHHQSNMTFVLNEETMAVVDSYSGIMNISYGYISHSFNQFIRTDGTNIYRADHGDAHPRGFSITKVGVNSNVTSVGSNYAEPFLISGSNGANDTGASLGGMELSANNVILAGNSVDQTNYNTKDCRNIFLTVTDKRLTGTKTVWLTHHDSKGDISVGNPQLVKVNDDLFFVTWVEYSTQTGTPVAVMMATVNGNGAVISGPVNSPMPPSGCQPIVVDGMIVWYVTNNSKPYFCIVNPKNLTPNSGNDTCILDHVWNSGTEVVPSTQTTPGQIRYNCLFCKATRTEKFFRNLPYISYTADASGKLTKENKTATFCKLVDNSSEDIVLEDGNTYAVRGTVTIDEKIFVYGNVNLILMDGAELTVAKGIAVNSTNTLNIYAQSTGDTMGKLIATGVEYTAGIGTSAQSVASGTINIHGGAITSTGGKFASGIGGGTFGKGGTVTINGGAITATGGQQGAGIGGGYGDAGETVIINGGTVTATGGNFGAGIGGGAPGSAGTITINGGTVTAIAGYNGAGIGHGQDGTAATVTLGNGVEVSYGSSASSITGTLTNASKNIASTLQGAKYAKAINKGNCSHVEVTVSGKPATCTASGLTDGTKCSVCGVTIKTQTTIPAKGHTPQTVSGKPATCTASGLTDGTKCSVCGVTIKAQTTIPAKGHTPQTVSGKPATCTASGLTDGTKCSVCGVTIKAQTTIPAKGHTPGQTKVENSTSATCGAPGSYDEIVYCTACNAELSRVHKTVSATPHTEVTVSGKPATCTTSGLTDGTKCSVCGVTIKAQTTIPAKGHTPQTVSGKPATCTTSGLTEGTKCSVCGETLVAQTTIPAKGHTWDNGVITTAPTTTKPGVKTYTCTVCKATRTESVPVVSGFADVSSTDWFAPYVNKAVELGLMNGVGNNKFDPMGNTSRAMFVQVLYAMEGAPAVKFNHPFTDVQNDQWYAKAIQWAYTNKVTGGLTPTTFGPDNNVTREQIAVFLYSYAGKPAVSGNLSAFRDSAKVSSWAKDAMIWATQNGIISGSAGANGARFLNPQNLATRGETATMMVGFYGMMK